jgi:ubiquinone/menaquinone biosynthesis C-methylase UbiE
MTSLHDRGHPFRCPGADSSYSLGKSSTETARLVQQAAELRTLSVTLLDRADLQAGDRAIDVGCGPFGVLDLLFERVGPTGRVVGLDADPHHVAMATQAVVDRDLANTEILLGDARDTGLLPESFDVVHARTLLINLPSPSDALTEMVRLAKPGGWVLSLEPDCEPTICYPPNDAYDRLLKFFPIVFGRNGADWRIGRHLPELYSQAGLVDIRAEVAAELYPPGHTRRSIRVDLMRSMRSQLIELGLAGESELERLFAEALAHLQRPETIVMPAVYFLVSGRKGS